MSTMQDFDYSQYIINGEMVLENLDLKDCKISGITNRNLVICNCNLTNVVLDNHFSEGYITFEGCRFLKCHFYDTYVGNAIELIVVNNAFEDCIFENIKYNLCAGQSEVQESKFTNCTFRNIAIDGQMCFIGLDVCGGSIIHLDLHCENIMNNQFTDMKMEQVNINRGFIKNKMNNIVFDEVVLHTSNYEKMYKDNEFVECNTDGLTIIQHD